MDPGTLSNCVAFEILLNSGQTLTAILPQDPFKDQLFCRSRQNVTARNYPKDLGPLGENSLERNTEIERQVRLHIVVRKSATGWR